MRRTVSLPLSLPLCLLLSLLLVCAQSAGLLHGIAHAGVHHVSGLAGAPQRAAALPKADSSHQPAPSGLAGARTPTGDGWCDKCFEFAHFSGGASPHAPGPVAHEAVTARPGGPQAALADRDAPAWRNRGPPITL